MSLPLVSFLFSLFFLLIASYTDLKQRIVPDKISYSMIASGLLVHLAFSVAENNFSPIVFSVLTAGATFFACYALWKAGVWAGGDVKLFTGMAALNPFNPSTLSALGIMNEPLFRSISLPVFPLTLFLFSVFSMMPVAIIIWAKKILRKGISVTKILLSIKNVLPNTLRWAFFLSGARHFFPENNAGLILATIVVFVFALLQEKLKTIFSVLALAAAVFYNPFQALFLAAALSAFMLVFACAFMAFNTAKKLLQEKKQITELGEGMIPAETIAEENKKITRVQPLTISRALELLAANKQKELFNQLHPSGRIIASHRRARGLTIEEIAELKELVRNKRLENHIMVKESVAFVPAVLFAYVALNIVGDVIWNLVF